MSDYNVVVIGSGPGGYAAAIRAAQLGMKTAVVESNEIGGVCLNWGCIPSKALLRNAEVLGLINNSDEFGISIEKVTVDFGKAMERSRDVVGKLTAGIEFLLKKNQVEVIDGKGSIKSNTIVQVNNGDTMLETDNIILATGARFRAIPNLPIDRSVVITSKEALALREIPRKVVIVGAGATGAEFAYLWRTYGAEVTLVELLPRLVPNEDEDISKFLERSFKKQGINCVTETRVEGIDVDSGKATVKLSKDAGQFEIQCDKVMVAIGMQGNIDGIGIENVGILTENGYIRTGDSMETNVPGIYAIGDVTGEMLLAHVAQAQAVVAVEHLAGKTPPALDYNLMPRATYCKPQIASMGLTEIQAEENGFNVKTGVFPFSASGKAMSLGETEGMVKVVADAEIGDLLGVHMIGPEVTELLGEVGMSKLLESTTTELGGLVHPHPTLSEAIKEAALATDGEAIHI